MDGNKGDVPCGESVAPRAADHPRHQTRLHRHPRDGLGRGELLVETGLELFDPPLIALGTRVWSVEQYERRDTWTYDEVAHHVCVAGVHEQADAVLNELRQELCTVVRAVALERERLVDLHVAARKVERGRDAERALGRGRVHPRVDPVHLRVTEIAVLGAVALAAYVVGVVAKFCAGQCQGR